MSSTVATNEVFDNNGSLGTFSAKIGLAYCMGLISENEHRLLQTIRKIRNSFAHGTCTVAFSCSDSIKDLVSNLSISDKLWIKQQLINKMDDKLAQIPSSNPWKKKFVKCVIWLRDALYVRTMIANYNRPDPVIVFSYAHQMLEALHIARSAWIEQTKQDRLRLQETLEQLNNKQGEDSVERSQIQDRINQIDAFIAQQEIQETTSQGTWRYLYDETKAAGLLDDEE